MKFYAVISFFPALLCFASLVVSQEDLILPVDDESDTYDSTRIFFDALEANEYNANILPEGKNGKGSPVEVLSTMYVLDVQKVDDYSMDFSVQFYFRQSWNDSRLQYDGIDTDKMYLKDVSKIWTPDLFFADEKSGELHKLMGPNTFCIIKPSGEVLFSSRLSMTLKCPMDLRKYPHDIQNCLINIESYGYQRNQLELNWDYRNFDPVTTAKEISMFDFEMEGIKPTIKHVSMQFGNYTALQVHLTFERKPGFFVTRLYLPYIIMVLLSSFSFWMNPKEKSLRLCLLLVLLYIMIKIGSGINDCVPPVPYTKGSDIWIAFCQSFVFAAFLEFIIVSIFSRKDVDKSAYYIDPESLTKAEQDTKLIAETKGAVNSRSIFMAGRLKNIPESNTIDQICRLLFPISFIAFCATYFLAYCINY